MKKIDTLQARIERIKQEIAALGEIRPGSISQQYSVCGNPNCRCADPENPQKHGPYHQLSYTRRGRHTTEFVREENLPQLTKQVQDYQTLKRLVDEWLDLSLEIARRRREQKG